MPFEDSESFLFYILVNSVVLAVGFCLVAMGIFMFMVIMSMIFMMTLLIMPMLLMMTMMSMMIVMIFFNNFFDSAIRNFNEALC